MNEAIRYEAGQDRIVVLTIDMPGQSANTMNAVYGAAMAGCVTRLLAEKDSIAGVIITSAKNTFFAGGDLNELIKVDKAHAKAFYDRVLELKQQLRALETLGKPVVAAINGAALGGGWEICLACHHRIALDHPSLQIGLPEVTLGLLPGGGGVVRMVRKLGLEKALPYLPAGADINKLTYDQLVAWSKNLAEKTGGPKFGFPAGPQGLKHRFFQGYLYPSYADSMVTEFRSAGAEAGWNMFKELWKYTHASSTGFNQMQEPLKNEQVWVAFDHIARLADAFNAKPNDFVAFPAPSGPTGRGFMPVLAGLAIPKTAPDKAGAEKLVAYLMTPEVQLATLRATNFFPTVDIKIPADMPASVRITAEAISKQAGSADANPGLLPVGLGALGGKFNQVYVDTFERVVLAGQPVKAVLDEQAAALRKLMQEANAPCWEPDKPSVGACPVK